MSLAISAYKINISSTGGFQNFSSLSNSAIAISISGDVTSTGPILTVYSSTGLKYVYNSNKVATFLSTTATIPGTKQSNIVTFYSSDGTQMASFAGSTDDSAPVHTFTGNIHAVTGDFVNRNQPGITKSASANYLSQVTTCGGIVTSISSIDIGTLTTGLTQYWDYSMTNNYYKPSITSVSIAMEDNTGYGWGTGVPFGGTKIIGSNNNYIKFLVNSVTGMIIDSRGDVGINTESTIEKFTVSGNITITGTGIYKYNAISGIHSPTLSNYLSQVTTSGGIVTAITNVTLASITSGLTQYWKKVGTALYPLTNNDTLVLTGSTAPQLRVGTSFAGRRWDFLSNAVSGYDSNGLARIVLYANETGGEISTSSITSAIVRANIKYNFNGTDGTTSPTIAGNLSQVTVSGGIVTAINNISLASLTSGLDQYWQRSGSTLRPINIGDSISAGYHIGTNANFSTGLTANTATASLYLGSNINIGGSITAATAISVGGIYASGGDVLAVGGQTYIKGDLNVDGSKNFCIDHPDPNKKDSHYLIYSALEGPEVGIYYRKKIVMKSNENEIIEYLPYYWKYFIKPESIQVFADSEELLRKKYDVEKITIIRKENSNQEIEISLLVFAERILAKGTFITEEEKENYEKIY